MGKITLQAQLVWAVLALVVVLPVTATDDGARDEAPELVVDHARLIAAMPDAVESVALLRVDQLRAEPFPLAEFAGEVVASLLEPPGDTPGEVSLETFVLREALRAEPIVLVMGGSEFNRPKVGPGGTEFNNRNLWVTSKPLTALQQQLRDGGGVAGELMRSEVRGYPVFSAEIEKSIEGGRDAVSYVVHVALVGGQIILTARCQDEMATMIDRLPFRDSVRNGDHDGVHGGADGGAQLPARWVDAAGNLDVQGASIVLFREYDPKTVESSSPMHPVIREQLGITPARSLALVMSDIDSMSITARLAGAELLDEQPRVTAADVTSMIGSSGYSIRPAPDDDGLRGELHPIDREEVEDRFRALGLLLLLSRAFGAPFFI